MIKFLKKKFEFDKQCGELIGAPVEGHTIPSNEIRDEVFREEMLGKGMAIRPTSGKVYAPVDGTVSQIFGTKHALSIISEGGAKIMIHIGLDTVVMKGRPFHIFVNTDDKVKKGDLIAEVDMDMIREAGLDNIIPIVIFNSADYIVINRFTGRKVRPGDDIMMLVRNNL